MKLGSLALLFCLLGPHKQESGKHVGLSPLGSDLVQLFSSLVSCPQDAGVQVPGKVGAA